MHLSKKENILFLIMALCYTLLTYFVRDNFFFWDSVQLTSKQAHHFFDGRFSNLLLPDSIDSGHVPIFGAYIALCWTLFGKNLSVSHFAMLPFLFGIIYEMIKLTKHFLEPRYLFLPVLVLLLDPTLVAQSTLMGPDIALMYFFLLVLNAILNKKKLLIAFGLVGLMLISMRGVMVSAALFCFALYVWRNDEKFISVFKNIFLLFLPSVFLFLSYQLYHYYSKSWVFYHVESPWAECFEKADFQGMIKNVFVFMWRLFDFGRLGIYIGISMIFLRYKKVIKISKKLREILILLFLLCTFLGYSFIAYQGLTGHRYILPIYIIVALLICYLIENYTMLKVLYYTSIITCLLLGHFIIYPDNISQGWDSSLAHYPYYSLRKEMNAYLEKNNIPLSNVGSAFPNLSPREIIDLNNNDNASLTPEHKHFDYILTSNIFNDMKRKKSFLTLRYDIVYEINKGGIYLTLYKIK